MNTSARRWYLTAIASIYLVLCTAGCVYYASLYFRPDSATVTLPVQAICLGMAAFSGIWRSIVWRKYRLDLIVANPDPAIFDFNFPGRDVDNNPPVISIGAGVAD